MTLFQQGDSARHAKFGVGKIEVDRGPTCLLRFDHGYEECPKEELRPLRSLEQSWSNQKWDTPAEVVTKVQSAAIKSVNDTWGIFSPSRIDLLPHQLWVCRRVLERWPARWLVADDVGLGKTIEAGLILWPLLASGRVKRLLVMCPASLVEQWQYRMRTMFDIRLTVYTPEADTPKTDFWGTHHQTVASMHTLRIDSKDRQKRLLDSEPWDLVVVDEAHHLNNDEQSGMTLGYHLAKRMHDADRIRSLIFFTGTPHRGKHFGFLSLVQLLRPDLFSPNKPAQDQFPALRQVMIRNNKQNVTDLQGNKIFQAPDVAVVNYDYTAEESNFYSMLTNFISSGKAYAGTLGSMQGNVVMLILIAMQKLAASSVAAIRKALANRIRSLAKMREKVAKFRTEIAKKYEEARTEADLDELAKLDDQLAQLEVQLMEGEEARLGELLEAAGAVTGESKMVQLIGHIRSELSGKQVLFFTEYKATQALLISELEKEFGAGCTAFINGDNQLDDIPDSAGQPQVRRMQRDEAADQFNEGKVRFLVSTEAGGEGIDLQDRCHHMFHVDLPWNPMRLHQRVGRLNRYGQQHRVSVRLMLNETTVEARIWQKLNSKISAIMQSVGTAMDEPEDLLQLVLGMTSGKVFDELFSGAAQVGTEKLQDWFDAKTKTFGGKEVLDTVRDLVGNSNRFDFNEVCNEIPKLDLPALRPFLETMLSINGRQIRSTADTISFKTPDAWRRNRSVRISYEDLHFDRKSKRKGQVVGVGHPALVQAMSQADEFEASVTALAVNQLEYPLIVYRVTDRVTASDITVRAIVGGVEVMDDRMEFLRDWEILVNFNGLQLPQATRGQAPTQPKDLPGIDNLISRGEQFLRTQLNGLRIPFQYPVVEPIAIIWPLKS